jgi:hypothetical protein
MTELAGELARLSTDEVPPVNHRFAISPHAAARLWSEGVPVPPEATGHGWDHYFSPNRILQSADGRWVIRRHAPPLPQEVLSAHETVEVVTAELAKLQALGINVVSHAITASPMAEAILTVSPWIEGLSTCDTDAFQTRVAPTLQRYFSQEGGFILDDIDMSCQYSVADITGGEPLLHDLDPDVAAV